QVVASPDPKFKGITLERLERDGWARLNVPEVFAPFAEGGFGTPSGKCEFYSERIGKAGLDPLPAYIPPREPPESSPDLAARFPIQLISPPANSFLNSTFSHLASFLRSEKRPFVLINRADAEPRGIADGDSVVVGNDRGNCTLVARISDRVKPGVACAL